MPNCLHPFGSEPQCTESPVYRRPQIVAVIVRMRPVPRLWALPGFRPAWLCPCSAGAGCELLEFLSLFARGRLFWAVRYVGSGGGGWWAVRGVGSEVDHSLD